MVPSQTRKYYSHLARERQTKKKVVLSEDLKL